MLLEYQIKLLGKINNKTNSINQYNLIMIVNFQCLNLIK